MLLKHKSLSLPVYELLAMSTFHQQSSNEIQSFGKFEEEQAERG